MEEKEENKVIEQTNETQATENLENAENQEVAKEVKQEKTEPAKTDDEIYEEIQAEKLLQKRKKKRIAILCGLSLAFVLALSLIIMAVVPISLKPACIGNDFTQVILYHGKDNPRNVDVAKFKTYYNKAFKQNFLEALFSGSLSYDIEENGNESSASSVLGEQGTLRGGNSYFAVLSFDEKEVTYRSGKTYKSRYLPDGNLTFTSAYIVLNEGEGVQDTTIYIPARRQKSASDTTIGKDYLITITVRSNSNIIVKNWDNLKTKNA